MIKLEELKPIVKSISLAVETLRKSGISEDVLVLLIQDACSPVRIGRYDKKPPKAIIRAVFDGMSALDEHVFPDDSAPK